MKKSVLISILLVAVFTFISQFSDFEIKLLYLFYSPQSGWFLKYTQPWYFLYKYGPLPGIIIASISLIIFISSFFFFSLKKYSRHALFLCLIMIIGPGLVVNAILKDYWGRPRPRQIKEFKGNMHYLKVWQKGEAGKGKSFPSGQASTGFYLFSPYFFLRNKKRKVAYGFLFGGMFYGSLIGLARMIQGAHFLSDVIWSGAIVYIIGEMLTLIFKF